MINNPFQRNTKADLFTEMVFEHRNKDYGAYVIRRDYNKHVNKALMITVSSLGLLLLLALILRGSTNDILLSAPADTSPTIYSNDKFKIEKPKVTGTHVVTPPANNEKFTNHIVVTPLDSDNFKLPDSTMTTGVVTGANHAGTDNTGGSNGGSGKAPIVDTTDYTRTTLTPQVMPEFPGGDGALHKYLSSKINCPRWQEEVTSGTIVFSLVVNRYGQVTDVKVIQDNVHFDCAQQAIRIIENMPQWSPGLQNNIPVNVEFILPIVFEKKE